MALAPESEIQAGNTLGSFVNAETNVRFDFGKTDKPPFTIFGIKGDLVKIYTIDGSRYAYLRKTRAYVIVDEDENGPVIETWPIKKKVTFWVG